MKITRFTAMICAVASMYSSLAFGQTIDLLNLLNYENQPVPAYINRDNTGGNTIDDATATLGRVLFYDQNLSVDNTVSCATCHQQEFAFSDPDVVSLGVNGVTGRHSMRLINSRFGNEVRFFWDERAATLEEQVTKPIQDHAEMGFSGANGDPSFADLIVKMEGTSYYNSLFKMAFGDAAITEARMKLAIAQFIRSIQSFDSKFDAGLAAVNGNLNAQFPNFTAQENQGKGLYLAAPQFQVPPPGQLPTGNRVGGGFGCQGCHQAPEFSIDPQPAGQNRNNGVIRVANNPTGVDLTNTRSPTLRDMFSPDGFLNGPMMHDGAFQTIDAVLNHYNDIPFDPNVNTLLDNRLRGSPPQGPAGPGQNLLMSAAQRAALIAFLKTLSGNNVYTDVRWSNPFGPNGELTVLGNVQLNKIEVGTSNQRSSVSSLTVKLAGTVQVLPGAFTVMQRSTATAPTFEVIPSTTWEPVHTGGQTLVTITFDGYVRNDAGSLLDGNYQMKVAGHLLERQGIPMGSDVIFGDEAIEKFYSFFGDTDGNRIVDAIDLAALRATYRKSFGQAGFNPILDYDNNGVVEVFDRVQFRRRYPGSIPFDFE